MSAHCLHWVYDVLVLALDDGTQNSTFSPRSPESQKIPKTISWTKQGTTCWFTANPAQQYSHAAVTPTVSLDISFFSRVEAHCCFLFPYLLDGCVSWTAIFFACRLTTEVRRQHPIKPFVRSTISVGASRRSWSWSTSASTYACSEITESQLFPPCKKQSCHIAVRSTFG